LNRWPKIADHYSPGSFHIHKRAALESLDDQDRPGLWVRRLIVTHRRNESAPPDPVTPCDSTPAVGPSGLQKEGRISGTT